LRVLLGFVQEYRAEKAIEALRQMAAPTATVLRDGEEMELAARDIVPGDVTFLRAGDKIPADVRLLEAINLQVGGGGADRRIRAGREAGGPLATADLALGDRRNMVYRRHRCHLWPRAGGRGRHGMNTEFGKIAGMLQTIETGRTPLQENLDRVGAVLARAAFVIVGIIVALGLLRGQDFIEMLIFGIALAVAVVPEALPAVVTISLAIGVQRMVKRNALMRRLPAVETLGSTSVICSDKTGTLTKDEMTVRRCMWPASMFEGERRGL
jgi:Ca2+-transporting ATPase